MRSLLTAARHPIRRTGTSPPGYRGVHDRVPARLLAQETTGELSGTLHLHATDGPTEWWIDLEATGPAVSGHITADTAICGTRSNLLLWLTNRRSPDSLEVLGRKELAVSWKRLRR
jgi:hypothetical protein